MPLPTNLLLLRLCDFEQRGAREKKLLTSYNQIDETTNNYTIAMEHETREKCRLNNEKHLLARLTILGRFYCSIRRRKNIFFDEMKINSIMIASSKSAQFCSVSGVHESQHIIAEATFEVDPRSERNL